MFDRIVSDACALLDSEEGSAEARLRLRAAFAPSNVREMIRAFAAPLSRGEFTGITTGTVGNLVLHDDGRHVVVCRRYAQESQFLYLHTTRYVEVIVRRPAPAAAVTIYDVANYDPAVHGLHAPLDRLKLVQREILPIEVGDVLVRNEPATIFDVRGNAGGYSLRILRRSDMPYELVFSRETLAAVGAHQTSSQASTLSTVLALIREIRAPDMEEPMLHLTRGNDPCLAWEALRTLDALGSRYTLETLEAFAKSPSALLARNAAAVLLQRAS